MRSPRSIDSSKKNSSRGTRLSRSRLPIWRRRKGVARPSARDGVLPGLRVAERRVIDAGDLKVRRDVHVRDGQEADARVVHFPGKEIRDLRAQLIADARGACRGHKLQGRREKAFSLDTVL